MASRSQLTLRTCLHTHTLHICQEEHWSPCSIGSTSSSGNQAQASREKGGIPRVSRDLRQGGGGGGRIRTEKNSNSKSEDLA